MRAAHSLALSIGVASGLVGGGARSTELAESLPSGAISHGGGMYLFCMLHAATAERASSFLQMPPPVQDASRTAQAQDS